MISNISNSNTTSGDNDDFTHGIQARRPGLFRTQTNIIRLFMFVFIDLYVYAVCCILICILICIYVYVC